MAIVSSGIGSGLDISSLISQLVAAERAPQDRLVQNKSTVNNQISAYGQIKSAVSTLQTAAKALTSTSTFDIFKAVSSNTNTLAATAASGSTPGAHTITVSKLASAEIKASQGFSTSTETLGSLGLGSDGSLTIATTGKTFDVAVSTTDTLKTLQEKINSALGSDGKQQTLAQASIINAGTQSNPAYKLIVSSSEKGEENAVNITGSSAGFFGFTQAQKGENAALKVDGVDIIRSKNSGISDVIEGLTLDLKDLGTTTLTVSRDLDAVMEKITAFTKAYNQLASTIGGLQKQGATLEADNTLTSLLTQLRGTFNAQNAIAGSSYKLLAETGITFQKDGTIAIDSNFSSTLAKNFDSVVALFSDSTNGKASQISAQTSAWLQAGGILDTRTTTMQARIKTLDTRIDQMDVRLKGMETRLRAQFSAMDSMVGRLKQTSSFLSQQLG